MNFDQEQKKLRRNQMLAGALQQYGQQSMGRNTASAVLGGFQQVAGAYLGNKASDQMEELKRKRMMQNVYAMKAP